MHSVSINSMHSVSMNSVHSVSVNSMHNVSVDSMHSVSMSIADAGHDAASCICCGCIYPVLASILFWYLSCFGIHPVLASILSAVTEAMAYACTSRLSP